MMRRAIKNFVLVVTCLPFLVSCGSNSNTKQLLGIESGRPDEFKVVTNPPLSMPPEFSLRPLEYVDAKVTKRFEKASVDFKIDNTTRGESAFLNHFGASDANPNIIEILEQESAKQDQKKEGFFGRLAKFSSDKTVETDSIVDSINEKDRLVKNKSEGKTATDGETPTVLESEEKGGFLNEVFGF